MRLKLVLAAAVLVLMSTMAVSSASAQYTGGTPPTLGPVLQPVQVVPGAQGGPGGAGAQGGPGGAGAQGGPGGAGAQGGRGGEPAPNVVEVVPALPSPVAIEVGRPIQAGPRPIALTGADIAQMILLGGLLVIGGAVLVRQGRRRVALGS